MTTRDWYIVCGFGLFVLYRHHRSMQQYVIPIEPEVDEFTTDIPPIVVARPRKHHATGVMATSSRLPTIDQVGGDIPFITM